MTPMQTPMQRMRMETYLNELWKKRRREVKGVPFMAENDDLPDTGLPEVFPNTRTLTSGTKAAAAAVSPGQGVPPAEGWDKKPDNEFG